MSEKDGLNKYGRPYGTMMEVLEMSEQKVLWFFKSDSYNTESESGGDPYVEYSAYEAAVKDRDQYKSALGGMAEYAKRVRDLEYACVDWETKVREITDERDEARDLLIRCNSHVIPGEIDTIDGYKIELQKALKERDEARAAIDKQGELFKESIRHSFREREDALKAKSAKLVEALDFYAKHHHHMNTTAPNFTRLALAEYDKDHK